MNISMRLKRVGMILSYKYLMLILSELAISVLNLLILSTHASAGTHFWSVCLFFRCS